MVGGATGELSHEVQFYVYIGIQNSIRKVHDLFFFFVQLPAHHFGVERQDTNWINSVLIINK